MSATKEREGRRIYLAGDTFALKERIKSIGGHWDGERKQWWVSTSKEAELDRILEKAKGEKASEKVGRDARVLGKVTYKGRSYYLIAQSKDEQSFKVTVLDGSMSFWCRVENGARIEKLYGQRGDSFPTLGSMSDFISRKKSGDGKRNRASGYESDPDVARKTCWECGRLATFRECRLNGGDWNCHSGTCHCGC